MQMLGAGLRRLPPAMHDGGKRRQRLHQNQTQLRKLNPVKVYAEKENPDFDEIELNDDYYKELGIDDEELESQNLFSASDIGELHHKPAIRFLFQPHNPPLQ